MILLGCCAATQVCAQNVPEGAVIESVQTGRIGPGRLIEVPTSDVPFLPNSAQIAAQQQALSSHLAPPLGPHATAQAQASGDGGPQTDTLVKQLPNSFTIFQKTLIHAPTCGGCGLSSVNEPTAANSGAYVVETSNWDIAYSGNAGTSFLHLNPYAFSAGFCCDQQVVYNADRDVFILLQLDFAGEGNANNGLALSVAHGSTPTSWCTYKFHGAIGGGATDTPDFPKIAVSNNNVFITWNDYPPHSGFARSGLARMPLDAIAACAGFSYSFLTRNTEFTFALANGGAKDKFYWVSNWFLDGTVSGQNMRIFWWPDNSGTYFWVTRGINAYTFGTVACGSPNWCSRLDPRYESVVITPAEYRAQANGAFAGDQILEIATTAGPSGFSNGHNYVVYNYFKLNSLSYIGHDQTYNTSETFAYPGCAVNEKGYVGCSEAVGSSAPGGIVILQDNVNPLQPWGFNFIVAGISGASAWGDYTVTAPWRPSGGPFQ
jgi:hypothetical protein